MRLKITFLVLFLSGMASGLAAETAWRNPPYGPYHWREISRTDDAFYVPSTAATLRSTNGRNWNLHSQRLDTIYFSIAQGPDKFLAAVNDGRLGSNGGSGTPAFHVSTNGTNFHFLKDAPHHIYKIVYGNGRFVTTGFEMSQSSDGTKWQRITTVPESNVFETGDLIFAGGKFLRATPNGIYVSENGLNWSQAAPEAADRLSYHNGLYAANGNNYIAFSTNGLIWESVPAPTPSEATALAVGTPGTVLVSDNLSRPVSEGIFSADKTNWVTFNLPFLNRPWDIKFIDNQFVMIGDGGLVAYSSDGTNWTKEGSLPSHHLRAAAKSHDRLVVVGESTKHVGAGLSSTNGVDWQELDLPGVGRLTDIANIDQTFVAVGFEGEVIVSTNNGVNWIKPSTVLTQDIFCVTTSPLGFVAGGRQNVATSTNGFDWNVTPLEAIIWDIAYGNGVYVSIASGWLGGAMISTNLANWQLLPHPYRSSGAVEFGNGKFVLGPLNWVSSDGINWAAGSGPRLVTLNFSEGLFTANSGGEQTWDPAHGYVSIDGSRWHRVYDSAQIGLRLGVYFGRFLALGAYGGILQVDNFGILDLNRNSDGTLNLQTIHPSKFTTKLESSTDFQTWNLLTDPSAPVSTSAAGQFFRLKLEPPSP